MSRLTLDASVTIAWLLDDELSPEAAAALDWVRVNGGLVPTLWHYEVRNGLLIAERRERLPAGGTRERLSFLQGLPILTDQESDLERTLDLATSHGLSFYDALYVELAARRRLPLATLDTEMLRAARREGIETFPS